MSARPSGSSSQMWRVDQPRLEIIAVPYRQQCAKLAARLGQPFASQRRSATSCCRADLYRGSITCATPEVINGLQRTRLAFPKGDRSGAVSRSTLIFRSAAHQAGPASAELFRRIREEKLPTKRSPRRAVSSMPSSFRGAESAPKRSSNSTRKFARPAKGEIEFVCGRRTIGTVARGYVRRAIDNCN